MSLFGAGIARRLGIWALIQALPGEAALRRYLRAAYMGVAGVIVGSVLTGAALAAGLMAAFTILQEQGWSQSESLLAVAGTGLVIIFGCFYLAAQWFAQLATVKQDIHLFNDVGRDLVGGAFNTLVEGFIEGMADAKDENELREARRRRRRAMSRK